MAFNRAYPYMDLMCRDFFMRQGVLGLGREEGYP